MIRHVPLAATAALCFAAVPAQAQQFNIYCQNGPLNASGVPNWAPASPTQPCPVMGTLTTRQAPVTWAVPSAPVTLSASGTIVAAGPNAVVLTPLTGTVTINLSGTGPAVANQGVVLAPGANTMIIGQSTAQAVLGVCNSGTCTVAVQAGNY